MTLPDGPMAGFLSSAGTCRVAFALVVDARFLPFPFTLSTLIFSSAISTLVVPLVSLTLVSTLVEVDASAASR